MPETRKEKTAMVMLASEQLWPNIHGLLRWAEQPDVRMTHLFICHSDDEQRSVQPARRLKALCERRYPAIEVHTACVSTPESVLEQMEHWHRGFNGAAPRWVFNITGGTKLMSMGLLDALALPHAQAVYRELNGTWYQLVRSASGLQSSPLSEAPELTDRIGVEDLVLAQWGVGSESVTMNDPQPLDVPALLQAAIASGWDWKQAFHQVGLDPGPASSGGLLFERFVAACLLAMGVKNLKLNMEYRDQDSGQALQEMDVVANWRGALMIVDCSLDAGEERKGPITTQIRDAAQRQRQLGGLNARTLMLRPSWQFSDAQRDFAGQAHVSLLDSDDAWGFFERLADFFHIRPLPPGLAACQQSLHRARFDQGGPLLSALAKTGDRSWQESTGRGLLDVQTELNAMRKALSQSWDAWRPAQGWNGPQRPLYITASIPDGTDASAYQKWIENSLTDHGGLICSSRLTNSRNNVYMEIGFAAAKDRNQMIRYLETRVGKSLLENEAPPPRNTSRPQTAHR